jgi:hypothetical protein
MTVTEIAWRGRLECAVCSRGKPGIQQFDALHSEGEQFLLYLSLNL